MCSCRTDSFFVIKWIVLFFFLFLFFIIRTIDFDVIFALIGIDFFIVFIFVNGELVGFLVDEVIRVTVALLDFCVVVFGLHQVVKLGPDGFCEFSHLHLDVTGQGFVLTLLIDDHSNVCEVQFTVGLAFAQNIVAVVRGVTQVRQQQTELHVRKHLVLVAVVRNHNLLQFPLFDVFQNEVPQFVVSLASVVQIADAHHDLGHKQNHSEENGNPGRPNDHVM
mmetsp:Transcript_98326/g.212017  ORF Transcript_98326/g.212017 Transcript_98326/m.212017 type:complete len:221 (-) Transcript_98326:555-1217(-)